MPWPPCLPFLVMMRHHIFSQVIVTAAVVCDAADDSASDSTAWLGSYNDHKAEETPQSNGLAITGTYTEG